MQNSEVQCLSYYLWLVLANLIFWFFWAIIGIFSCFDYFFLLIFLTCSSFNSQSTLLLRSIFIQPFIFQPALSIRMEVSRYLSKMWQVLAFLFILSNKLFQRLLYLNLALLQNHSNFFLLFCSVF